MTPSIAAACACVGSVLVNVPIVSWGSAIIDRRIMEGMRSKPSAGDGVFILFAAAIWPITWVVAGISWLAVSTSPLRAIAALASESTKPFKIERRADKKNAIAS